MGKVKQTTVSVSLVTINQLKRCETIKILAQHIKKQTYKHIVQWVIVEGSPTREDSLENAKHIESLRMSMALDMPSLQIDYVSSVSSINSDGLFNGHKLGSLRNLGNRACTGDITVCMDDDDYYFPTRVQHAVERLNNSKCLIAGCSAKYLYDFDLKSFYQFSEWGPYHSTNDCMAWKKEYITNHAHDPNAACGEEPSFTNVFKEPMVQLDPKHCIIACSHYMNTFSKKEICVFITIGIYPKGHVVDQPVDSAEFMGKDIFDQYSALYSPKDSKECECVYDIVYFTGGTSIEWDPEDTSLGGSEQAVVNLSIEWTKLGKSVAVYGKFDQCRGNKTVNGVDYFNWKKFDYSAKYKTIIMWRLSGVHALLPFDVKTDALYLDLHDNTYPLRIDYSKYSHKIDKIFFKSQYHVATYERLLGLDLSVSSNNNKYCIIPNGVRVEMFNKNVENVPRNPFRFVYCSCYTRGLYELLAFVWPFIYANEPRAELHVYYGMKHVQNDEFRKQMILLLSQPGVMDHGRVGSDMVAREKWSSSFHLYITDTDAEIDCISVRESLCSGCVPLLSNSGVFSERDGIHFPLDRTSHDSYKKIAQNILKLLQKQDFIEMCRAKFKNAPTILDWTCVAKRWMDEI